MATTIWSNKQIYHFGSSGYIKIDASYDYYRSGADMYYTVSVTVKQTGSASNFNDKVGCQIKLDGTEVYYNATLKGTTSTSTKTWSRTANVNNARVANKTTGTTTLSVRVWDSQGAASFDSTNTANLTVSAAMPILTVGTPSSAINYANFTITDSTGQTMTNYEIANSNGTTVQSGTLNSSSATIKFSEISGNRLSHGTKYSGYKIRAKNSIGWGNYVTIPDFTTVSLPNASTSGNFNIGNNTKITISSANYISAWSVSASDGSSTKTGTGSGTECTVAVGDSSYVNSMLANHPNDSSWTMTYVVHLYSDGVYVGYITVYNTCSIPSSSYNPTFTSDKVTYEDVNSAITSITGNNQKIIKGYSNVRFTIKPMTPGTGASASKYKVTANGTSQEAAHTGNNLQFTFNSVSSKSYSVQATDSRNKSTTVIGDYSTFIEYVIPSFATNNTKRTDQGIGSNVNINATFLYYNWSGLATTNTITEVKYKVGSGNWITIPSSDYTVDNGTLSINHTTTGESFSQDTIYTITISVKDRLATREANITIPSSQPLLWKDRLHKWLGIKKKPTCALDVDGVVSATSYLRSGIEVGVDPTDTFRNTIFGDNDSGPRIKTAKINSDVSGFSQDGAVLAFACGDTHGYINPGWGSDQDCWVGGGNAGRINWKKRIVFKEDLVNLLYPVGSVYLSMNDTNPSILFGGTWERITDAYLWATSSSNGGWKGGSLETGSTVLTVNQIPSHGHSISSSGAHSHSSQGRKNSGSGGGAVFESFAGASSYRTVRVPRNGDDGAHTHTANNTGGGQGHTHTINPTYVNVIMWKRTA